MSKIKVIFAGLCLLPLLTFAKPVSFNHQGVQKGRIFESCYKTPCSVAKILEFKRLNYTKDSAMLELTVLGGTKASEKKIPVWNKKPHKIYVTCSLVSPSITINGQVTKIPLNKDISVPGILISDAEIYLQACHNHIGDIDSAVQKYRYDVQD